MDTVGWRSLRKAAQQADASSPSKGSSSLFRRASQVQPMDDAFIGGWAIPAPAQPPPHPARQDTNGNAGVQSGTPSPIPGLSPHLLRSGYPFLHESPRASTIRPGVRPSFDENPLPRLNPVERSRILNYGKRRPNPYLQYMCGPLLRYDTIENGVWRGAALIVTTDAASIYEPHPILKCCWNPDYSAPHHANSSAQGAKVVDPGQYPAYPMPEPYQGQPRSEDLQGPGVLEQRVPGREIYVYHGPGGTYTFWRFLFQIPLGDSEMKVHYSINNGSEMHFFVPGRQQTMRLAAYSCNGFSFYAKTEEFCGPGFHNAYDPVWVDLLGKHAEQPFHLLVGGGDQLYCDGVLQEPELQKWINLPKPQEKKKYLLTDEVLSAIDRFYFNHYCEAFRNGAFSHANSSIPMLNMLGELVRYIHSIDGYGSYPDDLQTAPIFDAIGSRGYFFYLLFQCFINDSVDGRDDQSHVIRSTVIGSQGKYLPFPSHSFLTPIGPTAWVLMLDCRAERTRYQVCSEQQYKKVFERLDMLPRGVEHLVIQLGIPIAFPRMVFLEKRLESKINPLITLGRSGSLGLKRFANKFNGDPELLDDLNDHWTSKHHKGERNSFIIELQRYAQRRRVRISFLSGDVHCAAVGVFKTLNKSKKSSSLTPTTDHRYMLNVISSAIVNSPPPNFVFRLFHRLSTRRHETLHHAETDEEMVISLFDKDTDDSKPKSNYIMGRRNWCIIALKQPSGDLLFDIRVEKKHGHGETVG
ncbi:hypothetical protein BC826DRAFT_910742 [Russula brevipes]|nr:hypothetical protein BC826DRAFT_910742 [Russula brevipes]